MTRPMMEDQVAVSSLSDLAERLFTKPPAVQVRAFTNEFVVFFNWKYLTTEHSPRVCGQILECCSQ